ncbi:hypothetical protein PRELSG_0600300 [Plasmodium relictum]|uniref:Early transcribed membrane protein n=1 Tax=Plasmodium relictum TaxID=85471 RepID=A0A1J1H6G6_PLARL|nr:hypothetical protein PRELSG_0600300 [Plasmodium relictum]CRG99028.1 hypothetical protein PRELSG_0600300 [Plasmodium relictum]
MRFLRINFFFYFILIIFLEFLLFFVDCSSGNIFLLKKLDSKLKKIKYKEKAIILSICLALVVSLGSIIGGIGCNTFKWIKKKKNSFSKIPKYVSIKLATNENIKKKNTYEEKKNVLMNSIPKGVPSAYNNKAYNGDKPCYISQCEVIKYKNVDLSTIQIN